jgi:hypothetical protein
MDTDIRIAFERSQRMTHFISSALVVLFFFGPAALRADDSAYTEAHAVFELVGGDPSAEMLASWCEHATPFGADLTSETALGLVCAAYLEGFIQAFYLHTQPDRDLVCIPTGEAWPKFRRIRAIFLEYYHDWRNRSLGGFYSDNRTPSASVMVEFALSDAFPCKKGGAE